MKIKYLWDISSLIIFDFYFVWIKYWICILLGLN